MKCTFCGKEIRGYGNSSIPLSDDLCCDECNANVVVPYRIFLHSSEQKKITPKGEDSDLSDKDNRT